MILGVGIDVVDISRMDHLVKKHGTRFLDRIFTREETGYCMKRHDASACLAGRFAAKEATFKSLSSGRFSGIGFKDIAVVNTSGKPELMLSGKALSRAEELGVGRMHLSISHDKGCAVAIVIMEDAD